jgi:molybdate transport system ATP-binding protein
MCAERARELSFDVAVAFGAFTLDMADRVPLAGITALFGHSGSGKSTLLRILAGLETRAAGSVTFDGASWQTPDAKTLLAPHQRGVGYVFQDARLFPHLDVAGNLRFADTRARRGKGNGNGNGNGAPSYDTVVEALDLGALLTRATPTLSGGERQRVALARALLTRPRLVLMDEPLASIDGRRKREIMPYIEQLPTAFGIPAIYVTHSIDEVAALADRVLLVSEGRRIASGPITDMLSRLDLFPLTGRFEAGAIVAGRITAHDTEDGLTEVSFDGGTLTVPLLDMPVGSDFRLRIRARDVILSTSPPGEISANNVIECVVSALREDAGAFVDVQMQCGGTMLLARVTHRSVRRLGLVKGSRVFAMVKSTTIDRPVGPAGVMR